MVEHPGGKRAGLVTDTAILGGGHVINLLADGGCAIVTRGTVTHDTGVIKYGTNKGAAGAVTHATIFSGRNVCRRFSRGSGIRAIMTGRAIVTDAGMVEDRR